MNILLQRSAAIAGLLLSFSAFAANPHAASATVPTDVPPVDAHITYTRHLVSHAGVVREQSFKDHLIRRPGHIWIKRILPPRVYAGHELESAAEHQAHEHFDFATAALHLSHSSDGTLRVEYIDSHNKQVVFVPASEYAVVGFDGSWQRAGQLLTADARQRMQPSSRKSDKPDAVWLEGHRDAWFVRALWNADKHIALVIESGNEDGTVLRRSNVELLPQTPEAELPWKHLDGYEHLEYDDFLD
ncbi:MAG: hypothetical protein L0H29_07765 [Sinobacteraceae bacterium]|nr:hypothetical protein [Nevskiaceae bacterium]